MIRRAPDDRSYPCRHRGLETELQLMHETAPHGMSEDEQPVVGPRRLRPLALPWLVISQEVHFGQTSGKRVTESRVREQGEGRVLRERRVVAGLQEHQTVVIARAVRGRDAAVIDGEKQKSEP